jgi:hypothetical protein
MPERPPATCGSCGAQLAPDDRFCGECGRPVPAGTACPSCGAALGEGARFCASCGHAVAGAAPPSQGARAATAAPPPGDADAAPSRAAAPRRRPRLSRVVPLLLAAGAAAVGASLWRSGTLPGLDGARRDRLVQRLVSTPLPPAAHHGWTVRSGPAIASGDAEPDDDRVALITVDLSRTGGRGIAGFGFDVFEGSEQARASYAESTTYDQARYPKLSKKELARLQRLVVTVPGLTATCLAGDGRGACHALVDRTVVFVFMEGGGVEEAIESTRALADHVAALER